MDILRKSMAPITGEAWKEINETAVDVLSSVLSARKIVDVKGPMGWGYAALSTGRVHVPQNQSGTARYGIYQVQPLVEVRVPFELDIWELDNVLRGAEDIDLEGLEEAARKIAQFEEEAIYEGFQPGNIKGLGSSTEYDTITFPQEEEEIMKAVTMALASFKTHSIEGPYALVVNSHKWQVLNRIVQGYPLRKQIENLMGGPIILAPFVKDSFLVSKRGNDFRLVLGQDISIGYESHNNQKVQLYFTESFTFQVIEPKAVILLK